MSETKWTPGPWKTGSYEHATAIYTEDGKFIGCTDGMTGPIDVVACEQEANAHLISAAPELYSRLEWLTQQVIDELGWTCTEELSTLAKARGEPA